MNLLVFSCVLFAAVLHAGWNAVLRGGTDRLWSMTLMMISVFVASACAIFFLPLPARASWPYVMASAVIHTGYNLSLVRTYESGDLGQTYPVSRGSSPVLVAVGAAVFAKETLSLASCFGILLVSSGIVSLAFQNRNAHRAFLPAAFTTGALIGAYTVVDGVGVRLSGGSFAYSAWMFLLWSITMPPLYFMLRKGPSSYSRTETLMALAGGWVSILAYGIVIWAMQYGAMGVVSALRETSVVFAAVIGRFFLNERLSWLRLVSCGAIATGAACLAL
jgi:drug/metabolite transporter (DMT)-like permease